MPTARKNIFMVDDDPTNLMTVLCALESRYGVLTMNSGDKLFDAVEKLLPDLILLDVEMPAMNGYEIIRALKQHQRTANIPVIFLTAKSDRESEFEGLTLGAVDYISKPTPPPRLLQKRIEVHLLVEDQKKELLKQKEELINFNNNLQAMVEEKTKSIVELQQSILRTMTELVECRDDVTGGHIERTTRYLEILINALKDRGLYADIINKWDVPLILQSSQLHDVGKIAVRDNVLRKPGKLTDDEFNEIKAHTKFGEDVINKIRENTIEKSFLEHAATFAATHHEKWDGTGYPNGLKGEEIPLKGRLMSIADVYDALVSDRPYKKAFTHEEAVAIIVAGSGTHFDPALINVFVEVADQFNKVHIEYGSTRI